MVKLARTKLNPTVTMLPFLTTEPGLQPAGGLAAAPGVVS